MSLYTANVTRGTMIEIIDQLAGGDVPPVQRFVLMTQLRYQCGVIRKRARRCRIRALKKFFKSKKIDRRDRIKPACVECGYGLDGLDCVWFDEVVIGPMECPECGCQYPAVGK